MAQLRLLKIEGEVFFSTLALADRGTDLSEFSGGSRERTRGHGAFAPLPHPTLAHCGAVSV